jgi:hypothetical protein
MQRAKVAIAKAMMAIGIYDCLINPAFRYKLRDPYPD